jgi:hypothetical protein
LREELFTDFQRKLYTHHEAEELTILPAFVKIPELRDLMLELKRQHEDMKRHFEASIK